MIVDSNLQPKGTAHPADSRPLDFSWHKVVITVTSAGIALEQIHPAGSKIVRSKVGVYVQSKEFKRKRASLMVAFCEELRNRESNYVDVAAGGTLTPESSSLESLSVPTALLDRAERFRTKRPSKNQPYAKHSPTVVPISDGKARNPCEYGVKISLMVTRKQGLMVGARNFPDNPCWGQVLSGQFRRTLILIKDIVRAKAGHCRLRVPKLRWPQLGRSDHQPRQDQIARGSRQKAAHSGQGEEAPDLARQGRSQHRPVQAA